MGRYIYCQPSSSEQSLDYGSEGEFGRFSDLGDEEVNSAIQEKAGPGIPARCVCGLTPITLTSTTEKNSGRVFYGCKNSMDGGHHLFKWLDEALMDEMKEIQAASTTQLDFIQRMQDWYRFQEFPNIQHLTSELDEVKALLIERRSAMTLAKKIKEWKHLSIASLIITFVLFYVICKMDLA